MKALEVRQYVKNRIQWLQDMPEHPRKAALANLRRGIGRIPGDMPELWGMYLQDLPESMQRESGYPTREEWAVYLSLTLYAMHQQGHSLPADSMNQEGERFGRCVRKLIQPEERPEDSSILRRFNALATAADMQECAHYLRGVIQLLRAESIPLDYPQLAWDLYELQLPDLAPRVRLRWGQDFYRISEKVEKEKNNEEQQTLY